MIARKKTRVVSIGKIKIGGDNPVTIQSMCNTKTTDLDGTIKQIKTLEKAGCQIIRISVPDMESAKMVPEIKKAITIPLVADIHFDYKIALKVIPHVDKLRINPGNIGDEDKIKQVVDACKEYNIPIRIGVNSGSIDKEIEKEHGRTPKALVESALRHVKILENLDFNNIVLSLKASTVLETIESYREISKIVDYPLHVGVTEAGTSFTGTIKSSVGIGTLLAEGIGDTIRVSLTADPVEEIKVGKAILHALELRKARTIVSCPTCARTEIDIITLATEIEEKTAHIKEPITIAVMGCVVNGPGEASHADYGVAGGKGKAAIFKEGKVLKTVDEKDIVTELLTIIKNDMKSRQK